MTDIDLFRLFELQQKRLQNTVALAYDVYVSSYGTDRDRTDDLALRRRSLYPTEPRSPTLPFAFKLSNSDIIAIVSKK